MTIAIIGAGLAGLACAEALAAAGRSVTLIDKGHRPGGRMTTRRVATPRGETGFDHGAQYFSARDPAFRAKVESWREARLVASWPAAGPEALVGTPGMSAPVAAMAAGLDVRTMLRVDRLDPDAEGWRLFGEGVETSLFEAVVVSVPAEQVAALVGPFDKMMAARAEATRSAPCWTLMAAYADRLPILADVMKEQGPIGWAARNRAKPGRSGCESWVIQGSPDWSRVHLEDDPSDATTLLLDAFAQAAGTPLPPPISVVPHRWRYAMCGRPPDGEAGPMWNAALRLGVCGDWTIGPRLEAAWLSGDRLARMILI